MLYNILKTLGGNIDKVCDQVANNVASRFVSDSIIGRQQNGYGVTWRRSYVRSITAANVKNVILSIPRLIKEVKVTEKFDEDGIPIPV